MARLAASLTARLVLTAVALVALVSVLIATATTLALHEQLTDRLDADVRRAHDRDLGALSRGAPLADRPPGDGPGFGDARGQGERTLTAYVLDDGGEGFVLDEDGGEEALSDEALAALAEAAGDDGDGGTEGAGEGDRDEVRTVSVPGLGDYRVVATSLGSGTLVTGLPTERVRGTLTSLVGWEALFTGLGVAAAGGAAWVLVRRQLRPLREVARTAHEVAALPLAQGEIGVTARVADELTDERTEVGRVGAALNTLLGQVERALDERHRSEQQVRRFVADASHELRTPLATIQGYAELSRRTRDDAGPTGEAMRKVETEAARMTSLVEDLLLLARLDAGRPLATEEVDLTRLVVESTADARVLAPDHVWQLELPDEPVTAVGDEQRLHQVVTNLVTNARRHTPPGTTVTVGTRREADLAVVTVHDDGPGLPEHLAGRVFDRFSRGDTARTRSAGGSGLGLSIARAISTAHGGDLSVTSQPGSTTFTLTVPVSPT